MTETPDSDDHKKSAQAGLSPLTEIRPDSVMGRVLRRIAERGVVARNTNTAIAEQTDFGGRMADAVARFGGSWGFIILFILVLVGWTFGNVLLAARAFDPYPFIFLNLVLSMIAAIQAPIIMMSQNRQAARDRLDAEHDYAVNLKSEIEIMALHEKLDRMREQELQAMISRSEEQIRLLTDLVRDLTEATQMRKDPPQPEGQDRP